MNNKRLAEYKEENSPKRIKPNESTPLSLLKEQIVTLLKTYEKVNVEIFKDRLIHQYKQFLLCDILRALDDSHPFEKLKMVLSDYWHLSKNSIVCYTALPDDEVTLLLCDIAQLIFDQSKDKTNTSLLSILMPDVYFEMALLHKSLSKKQVPHLLVLAN